MHWDRALIYPAVEPATPAQDSAPISAGTQIQFSIYFSAKSTKPREQCPPVP